MRKRCLGSALLLVMFGCASPEKEAWRRPAPQFAVTTVHDPSVPFPRTGTYDWFPRMGSLPGDAPFTKERMHRMVRSSIGKVLAQRGFYRQGGEGVSFFVAYYTVLEKGVTDASLNALYTAPRSASRWFPGRKKPRVYGRGTLVVDIVCAADSCPRWRSSVSSNILEDISEEDRQRRMDAAVRALFAAFPPGRRSRRR